MTNRTTRTILAIALLTGLMGGTLASSIAQASTHIRPQLKVVSKGHLTIGSDESYPPMESQNTTTGKAVGADIDLGKAIAKRMGLKAVFTNVTFDQLIPELTGEHPFDVIMSSMNDTPGRRSEGVTFVDYLKAVEAIVVPKSGKIHANGYAGVCGLTVSVENGTTEQAGMQAANNKCKKKINILGFDSDNEAYLAFAQHEAEAYTTDYPVAAFYVKHNAKAYRLAGKVIRTGQRYGIGIRKSDKALYNAVKSAFKKVKASGQYLRILKKYDLQQGKI